MYIHMSLYVYNCMCNKYVHFVYRDAHDGISHKKINFSQPPKDDHFISPQYPIYFLLSFQID